MASASKLTQLFLMYLARQLNEGEIMQAQQCFNSIDKTGSGILGLQEFIEVGKANGLEELLMKDLFVKLDFADKKAISYSQFVAATIQSDGLLTEDKIKAAFRVWDLDKDGVISPQDFDSFGRNEMPIFKDSKLFVACLEEIKSSPPLNLAKFVSMVPFG